LEEQTNQQVDTITTENQQPDTIETETKKPKSSRRKLANKVEVVSPRQQYLADQLKLPVEKVSVYHYVIGAHREEKCAIRTYMSLRNEQFLNGREADFGVVIQPYLKRPNESDAFILPPFYVSSYEERFFALRHGGYCFALLDMKNFTKQQREELITDPSHRSGVSDTYQYAIPKLFFEYIEWLTRILYSQHFV